MASAIAALIAGGFLCNAHAGTPYLATALALPGTVQAENFDKGGEGVGYHELSSTNTGGQYRTAEAVDIVASADATSGGFVVNNFQTGEWLAYSVTNAALANYDVAVRVSNNYSGTPTFHVEVDGVNVSGTITVPKTSGWDTFQWVNAKLGLAVGAGSHVVKVVSDSQYFNFDAVRLSLSATQPTAAATYTGTPYTGSAIALPKIIEAENFDKGGEGVAYHDLSAGNSGGQYRTSENVDITAMTEATPLSTGGQYVINNFQNGEWLNYSVNVATAGNYDIALNAANNYGAGSAHVEVDGKNVTGAIAIPKTGGWETFQWFGVTSIPLSAGKHVLKVVADAQYFNLNALSVLATGSSTISTGTSGGTTSGGTTSGGTTSGGTTSGGSTSTSGTPVMPALSSTVKYTCDFPSSPTDCGFTEQNALGDQPGRASVVNTVSRTGGTALRLHTEPGDSNVHGSGTWERDDVSYEPNSSYCNEGQEEWWAVSTLFPSDYVFPPGPEAGIIMDFHHNYSSGQSNFEVQMIPGTGMRFEGHGGSSIDGGRYDYVIADPYGAKAGITKNVWYDFVYHAKWTSSGSGLMEGWLNGKKVMSYSGPTLYSGISCYLKLANYHAPNGSPVSVIFDRVLRGTSASAVSLGPLEGVQ